MEKLFKKTLLKLSIYVALSTTKAELHTFEKKFL